MKATRGFTLVELMVTLVVLTIAISIAVPSFSSLIASNRASGDVSSLTTALVMARTEAIKRNTIACVTPTNSNWASGWDVRYVADRSKDCSGALSDVATPVVRTFVATQTGSTLKVQTSGANTTHIDFLSNGARSGVDYTITYFSKTTCDPNTGRVLTIGATGRTTVAKCS